MQEWWESLTDVLRVLYCIAVPSTMVLLLRLLLMMFGGGGDGGVDISDTSGIDMADGLGADAPDIDAHAVIDGGNPADFGNLQLLTVQTLVTFLAVFGWMSIICISSGMPVIGGCAVGVVSGTAMMLLVAKLVQASRKLVENGILNMKNAIGETATVYLTIPPKNGGTGKVTMRLQGRFGEFDAVNSGDEPLPMGTQVTVTDVNGDILIVEKNT